MYLHAEDRTAFDYMYLLNVIVNVYIKNIYTLQLLFAIVKALYHIHYFMLIYKNPDFRRRERGDLYI